MDKNERRILHICKVFLPEKGGVQRIVEHITSLDKSHQHTVLTTADDGAISREDRNGVSIIRCRSYAHLASMPIAPSIISAIKQQKRQHELIAVHYPFPLVELAYAFILFSPPIVVHWHSRVIAQRRLKWVVAPFTFLLLARAKAIVVTSDRMITRSRFLRFFQNKVSIIPYGIPTADESNSPATIDEYDKYLLLIGRHVSYKGINIAINSMQNVQGNLVIVGDGPLFEKHKKLALESDASGRIHFERHAEDSRVNALLKQSTGLVVPSVMENEAFAVVQLEAMRLAKPIINTNLPSSVPWVARHNKEALTVEPSDVDALANAMNQLLCDSTLAHRLGDAGHHRFIDCFTGAQFERQVENLYESLLGQQ
ncbi:glycosyltransferase [Arenicella xantha]|uniref:Rhamnosyl/mannosyltransferase n=1 Tax=Arenicella xantha TaxID=644221 RepID=A0A395JJY8_9GAMM|nr:glycosyltransferase [Arenicella xantha]RBP51001.1 rhamnosyl/mannosyltransferase [Arenicella xantha]